MKTILLTLLIATSAHAGNVCSLLGKCKICHQCDVNRDKCAKKAGKDKDKVNTCDFNLSVCKLANKCEVEDAK